MRMKRLLIPMLLLAACDSQSETEAPSGTAQPAGATDPLAATPAAAQDAAQLQSRAAAALTGTIADPQSANYSGVRAGTAGSICGAVDAKQPDGKFVGPRPFVVTPEGVAVVSPTAEVMFNDASDLFPDFYIRWCASPAELAQLGPRVAMRGSDPPMPEPPVPDLPPDDPELPPPPAEPPPPPPAPRRDASAAPAVAAAEPQRPKDDSFSSAVLRPRKEKD